MTSKKTYLKPELYRVELRPDQAVLSACSLTTTTASSGTMLWCRFNCKSHSNMSMSDSGARPS